MAAKTRTHYVRLLAPYNILAFILIGTLVAGLFGRTARAQIAEQTSSGMQITLPASAGSQAPAPAKSREDDAQDQLLAKGMQMIKSGRPADALAGPIAQVIAYYENGVGKDHSQRHYCARSMVEVLLYTAGAAKDHQSAEVLTQTWANAYFEESSALIDLGRIEDSRAALHKAIALSPWNSLYLSELAYTFEMQHDNGNALDIFSQAEGAAEFSPPDQKNAELAHALRGEGYALTELHRLDEAETMYHKALKLDPNDQKSKNELQYIAQLRAKLNSEK